jgi:hypothetical protein
MTNLFKKNVCFFSDEKTGVQEASNILNELNGPIIKSGTVNATGTGCHCVGYNCGCCLFIKVKEIGLDDTGME